MESTARGIVVGYDGSPGGEAALDWAAVTAKRQGLPLTILHSAESPSFPVEPTDGAERLAEELADISSVVLEVGVQRATKVLEPSEVTGETVFGTPAAELVQASETAEMVVTGCRGRGRVAAGLLGSVSYAVTAHARCPAVVVRGETPAHPDAEHRVVVGVDDSESSEAAITMAATMAAGAGALLHIVRVGHMRSPEGWAYAESSKAGTEHTHAMRAEVEGTLTRAVEKVRATHPDLPVETEVLYGDPGRVISDLGATAGLIVVGSRGRGGFAGLMLGSVSHRVIHEAACPVMVVRG